MALPIFIAAKIEDEDNTPCGGCPLSLRWKDHKADIKVKQATIMRYSTSESISAPLDPVDVLVVADAPTYHDNQGGSFWSDKDGGRILGMIKAAVANAGLQSFAVVPAVRCYPCGEVSHFVLKKKYKGNSFKSDRKPPLEEAEAAVVKCRDYVVRAVNTLKPKVTIAMGPLAIKALDMGASVAGLRVLPLHPRPGLALASKREGTMVTYDRSFARTSRWARADLLRDLREKLPNILATGYAFPEGDRSTIDITVLDTVDSVKRFVDLCFTSEDIPLDDFLTLDFETEGLDLSTVTNRLLNVGFSFKSAPDSAFVIPLAHPQTPFSVDELAEVYAHLKRLFQAKKTRFWAFVAHNAQFETQMIKLFFDVFLGEDGNKSILDTQVIAYLMNENRRNDGIVKPYSLETLASEMLGFRWYAETAIKGKRDSLSQEDIDTVNEYVGIDAAVTARLINVQMQQMEEEGSLHDLMRVASKLYSEAIRYTSDLTMTGQGIDVDLLRKLRAPDSSIVHRLREIEEIFAHAPEVRQAMRVVNQARQGAAGGKPLFKSSATAAQPFSLASHDHRRALFWDVMKLLGANESVDKNWQELHKKAEPLVAVYQEYQQLSKLDSSYLEPTAMWLQKPQSADCRIRPRFNLINTTSGRLSATDPNCYDAETEILTNRGWVAFPSLQDEDKVAQWHREGTIDFVKPTEIIRQVYAGPMVSLRNQHIDLLLTPNHRCPVVHRRTGYLRIATAETYPEDYKQLHAGRWAGGPRALASPLVTILCAAQADGAWRPDVKQGAMEWSFTKERKVKRLQEALDELEAPYTYRIQADGRHRFYLSAGPLLGLIEDTIGNDKVFRPEWLLSLDRATLDSFVGEINLWDGCSTTDDQYTSVVKQNTDVVQIALTLSGQRATVNRRDSAIGEKVYGDAWTIYQSPRDNSMTTNIKKETVQYDGTVYCVTVPSSFVVVRRRGRPCVSGNSQQLPRGDTRDKKQIKAMFRAALGKILVQLDFSQAEVRWLGIMSGDKALSAKYALAAELQEAILKDPKNAELKQRLKVDGDIHMSTALVMYKLPMDLPFTDEKAAKLARQKAKTVCFGLIYGKNYKSLAKDLKISDEEAKEAVDLWMAQFPEAAAWLDNIDNTIEDTCIARSPFGRWRRLPEAAASDVSVANRAKRQARNTPIQSAASDFCIYAACKLRRALRKHPDVRLREHAKLINTVHDSLTAELPAIPEVILAYATLARDIFTDPHLIEKDFGVVATVPLAVDFDIGVNWGNLTDFDFTEKSMKRALYDAEVIRKSPPGTMFEDVIDSLVLYDQAVLGLPVPEKK